LKMSIIIENKDENFDEIKFGVYIDDLINWCSEFNKNIKKPSNSYDIKQYLNTNNKYLITDEFKKITTNLEDVIAITYSWRSDFFDMLNNIKTYIKDNNLETNYVWIDVICVNQNISVDPNKNNFIYLNSKYHMIMNSDCLYRGWCQKEIAIRLKTKKKIPLFVSKYNINKEYLPLKFENSVFSWEDDRKQVKENIIELFKNIDHFDEVLNRSLIVSEYSKFPDFFTFAIDILFKLFMTIALIVSLSDQNIDHTDVIIISVTCGVIILLILIFLILFKIKKTKIIIELYLLKHNISSNIKLVFNLVLTLSLLVMILLLVLFVNGDIFPDDELTNSESGSTT